MAVPARYHNHRNAIMSGVDKLFAEDLFVAFLKDGKADPERENATIEGVLRVGFGEAASLAGGNRAAWKTRIAAGKAELHIDPAKEAGLTLREGDKIRAITRQGQPWFEVLKPLTSGESRMIYELGVAG